jgi:hypothetical protein
MSRENPTWGAPRIVSELALLGYDVAGATVAKYMVHTPKPPSQTWRTFLDNHLPDIAACDFFTVPAATFRNSIARWSSWEGQAVYNAEFELLKTAANNIVREDKLFGVLAELRWL